MSFEIEKDNKTKERITEEFLSLSSIDSVSLNERLVADALLKKLSDLGIKAVEDNVGSIIGGTAGNIYAIWEGEKGNDSILLSAHMDTMVPGIGKKPILKENGVIESDKTTVLGADDLAGVTEILEGIRRVKESGKKHRTVEILFTVSEETYTKGAKNFDYSIIQSKQAYCLDLSGDVGTAVNRAPTLLSFRICVKGKAAHAGFAPEKGVNAIATAAAAIAEIHQGHVGEDTTINIGTIKGGSVTNVVSEECVVEGEIRSFIHNKAIFLYEDIESKFTEKAVATGATVDYSYTLHLKAYEVKPESAVIKNFRTACEKLSLKGDLRESFGGADNHQFNAHGIEGIVLSCGMENVHSTDEYITVDNLVNGAKLVEELILI